MSASAGMEFRIIKELPHGKARLGQVKTKHGIIATPVFMPVGTKATVKALTPEELEELGAEIILANTFHLYLRPGAGLIKGLGGLHKFMHWEKPLLTDSGGFQCYSLSAWRRLTEQGMEFRSPLDGSYHLFTPETSIEVQNDLGADIIVAFDECIPYPSDYDYAKRSTELTLRWAERCQAGHGRPDDQSLFGIVQGGMYEDLRKWSAEQTARRDFAGYAIGGLSVGEPRELTYQMLQVSIGYLPEARPRYVMGVGTPCDLVMAVDLGADMFDCVLPTRNARNGNLFTWGEVLSIKRAEFKDDPRPIAENCSCYTCQHYSRAYLRHLYVNREMLAGRLNTIHNLHFFFRFMEQVREAIGRNQWEEFKQRVLAVWGQFRDDSWSL